MHPLPPYARRIEYLESTGTQWLDTGFAPTATTRVEMTGLFSHGWDPAVFVRFGSRYSVTQSCFGLNSNGPNGNLRFDLGSSSTASGVQWQAGTDTATRVVIDANTKYAAYVTDTGTPVEHTFTSNMTFADAIPLAVFAFNANPLSTVAWQMRVSSLKIWNNGTPVRSFIPCRILDTGYLWDEVEGRFYGNQGTGDFVLGPDVREGVVPTPMNPFGVGRRQEEIRRVEYLESTGTNTGPWIDTGVVPDGTTRWEMDVEYGLSSVVYMGVDATQKFRIASRLGGNMDIQFALGTVYAAIKPTSFGGRHSVYLDATTKKCGVDAASANIAGSYSMSGSSIYLFGANNGSGVVTLKRESKIYGCRIFQSGTLVRDLIPVAVGSTGYLLDRVSGQLFGNQGTGAFVLGPDVVPRLRVWGNGTQSSLFDISTPYPLAAGNPVTETVNGDARSGILASDLYTVNDAGGDYVGEFIDMTPGGEGSPALMWYDRVAGSPFVGYCEIV